MNPPIADEEILEHVLRSFTHKFELKFRAGMAKYRTPLIEKDVALEAVQEVLDLMAYISANQLLHRHLALKADDLLGQVILQPELRDFLEEIVHYLGPKHLAAKISESAVSAPASPDPARVPSPTYASPLAPLHHLVSAGDSGNTAQLPLDLRD